MRLVAVAVATSVSCSSRTTTSQCVVDPVRWRTNALADSRRPTAGGRCDEREVVSAVQRQIDPIDLRVQRAETQMSGNRGTDDHAVDPVLRGSARCSGGCAHGPVLSGGGDATAVEPTAGEFVPSITREVIDGRRA